MEYFSVEMCPEGNNNDDKTPCEYVIEILYTLYWPVLTQHLLTKNTLDIASNAFIGIIVTKHCDHCCMVS